MSLIQGMLDSNRYATISTVDESSNPWAAPVWYVADDSTNIYWWSPIGSQHSQNISRNPNVYITIFDSTLPEGDGLGLYAQATAAEVPDTELDKVITLYNDTTTKFKMSRQNCIGEAPTRLYKATISKMWINDGTEENGFWQDIRKEETFK